MYDVSLIQPNHLGHTCSLGSSDLSIPHIAVVGLSSLASAAQSLIHVLKHDASLRAQHVTLVFGAGAKRQENEKGNIEIATEDGHDLLLIADALAEWQASCDVRYLQKVTLVFLPRQSHGFALFTTTWMTKTHRKDAARDVVDLVRAILRQSDLGVEVVGWEALVGLERGKKSGFRKAFNGDLKARNNDTGNDGVFKLRAPKVAWGQATSAFETLLSNSSTYSAATPIDKRVFANQPLQLSTRAQYLGSQIGRDVIGDQAYIEWLQGPRGGKYGGRPVDRVSNTVAT